jgi:hypothetical protein
VRVHWIGYSIAAVAFLKSAKNEQEMSEKVWLVSCFCSQRDAVRQTRVVGYFKMVV